MKRGGEGEVGAVAELGHGGTADVVKGVVAEAEVVDLLAERRHHVRIWTAAELERLTPDERQRVFNEGVVTDLDQVSPEFLARVRAKGRALLEELGLLAPESGAS